MNTTRNGMDRPNILFILSDDQGPWAMGCAGNREIITPNLDRLAASGTRFSSFFCTSPVCSPARASLLTGRIPSQHGVHDWIRDGNTGDHSLAYLEGQTGYTDILAGAGWRCGLSGKWHLGDSLHPQKSFSHWFVHQSGGGPYYNAPMVRDGKAVNEPGYVTDVMTDEALRFLDRYGRDAETPFCLEVHYTAPHSPWIDNHPPEVLALYEDCPFASCPQPPDHPWIGSGRSLTATVRKNVRGSLMGYFAAVTAMDANIGRLLDKLETLGIRERTLVCFLSDNGFNCGHHGFWGKGNGTFPLNMYDNSVKVPAIMSRPGHIPEGRVCDALLSGYDFMPTLLDLAGTANPEAEWLPGKSFAGLLRDGAGETRDRVVVYDEYGPVRMIRSREWKYVHRYPYGPHELYDLANDPGEEVNRAEDSTASEVLKEMKASLDDWFSRYVDPAVDGAREGVTGLGQLGRAGPAGRGEQAFLRE